MKILVVCYSLTGKTKKIAEALAESIGADFTQMKELHGRTLLGAYTLGALKAQAGKATDILPIKADVADYDCIVVASPVWARHVTPAINDFIRDYAIDGKLSYGLLTYSGTAGNASKQLRDELEAAGTTCRSIITIKSEPNTLRALRAGKIQFVMDETGKIRLCKVKSNAIGQKDDTEQTSDDE